MKKEKPMHIKPIHISRIGRVFLILAYIFTLGTLWIAKLVIQKAIVDANGGPKQLRKLKKIDKETGKKNKKKRSIKNFFIEEE